MVAVRSACAMVYMQHHNWSWRRWRYARIMAVVMLLGLMYIGSVQGDEHTHKYENGEQVVVWMSTVGPYHNRQETYEYFLLPFCRGSDTTIYHHHETIGEALQGIDLKSSGLKVGFKEKLSKTFSCSVVLNELEIAAFKYAIKHHYWYQMYIDDLPVWGIVGSIQDEEQNTSEKGVEYIYTKKRFDFGYNENQIVEVSLTSDNLTPLVLGETLEFSYEVHWSASKRSFADRFDKYLDPKFFQHQIHWFSIFNSFMMVIFLVGLVFMILMRTLRKDFARYSRDDDLEDMERDLGDEYGWKQVHGDVFRPPSNIMAFSAFIGAGHQLLLVVLCVIIFAIAGDLYEGRGSILTTIVFVYAATAPVAGYFSGSMYARMCGKEWIKNMIVTASLVPSVVCSMSFALNFIAMYYSSSRAIPFTTMFIMACLCVFVILPLTLVGTVLGRNMGSGQTLPPCRVNAVPRPIPEKQWYSEVWVMALISGILPFGSIFIEIHFIFTSFWAYKVYYVYGFMLLVYLILLVVTMCATIVCIYFLLNSEDYRWTWVSFIAGASSSGYVYVYAIYYFFFKTRMYGFFQTSFYFCNMALCCFCLCLLCGTTGYIGTKIFVHKIYTSVKLD